MKAFLLFLIVSNIFGNRWIIIKVDASYFRIVKLFYCKVNILFLLRSLDIGGLEVVTAVLANKFFAEGHRVSIYAFEKRNGKVLSRFAEGIDVVIAGEYRRTNNNIKLLRKILVEKEIDIVINQWGLPLIPIKTLRAAKQGLNIKVISVYHNDPLQNGRIQSVETNIANTQNPILECILKAKKLCYRCVTGYAMRYIYQQSDIYEVLSPSFVSHFQYFTWLKNTPKIVVQTNPITIDIDNFKYDPKKKCKEIIFVGRVDFTQKRVHRVIETWALLERTFSDWDLTIVGDGEERENIEYMVSDLKLQNVRFEGFQSPRSYYERASILLLTSEFEGFPLVLAECMSFGVVPAVYGSYSAVYDIIEDGVDGIIIPKTDEGFNSSVMAEKIMNLMNDSDKLNAMALAAIEKSKNYSIDIIYNQWMEVFQKILKNGKN